MPIGHSPLKYLALRSATFLVDCIGPLSLIYSSFYLYNLFVHFNTPACHSPQHGLPLRPAATSTVSMYPASLYSSIATSLDSRNLVLLLYVYVLPIYMLLEAAFFIRFRYFLNKFDAPKHAPRMSLRQVSTAIDFVLSVAHVGVPLRIAACPNEQILHRASPPSQHSRLPALKLLFARIMNENDTPDQFRAMVAGWFFWKDDQMCQLQSSEIKYIGTDNLRDWLAWAFFSLPSIPDPDDTIEGVPSCALLNDMVSVIEQRMDVRLEQPSNPAIGTVKLNFNEIEAFSKPLLVYACVFVLESLAFMFFRYCGFVRFIKNETASPQPESAEPCVPYWLYAPQNPQQGLSPIVFIHGIGGGLFCYTQLIYKIMSSNFERPMFLVELPFVSMRLVDRAPTMLHAVSEIEEMLTAHGFKSANFVGHSLGTQYCSWIVKHSKMVDTVVLIDPICFKCFHPSLAFNFIYRVPGKNTEQKANEFLMHWLASRELYTSHYISRNFHWFDTVLFPDDLPKGESTHVILSGKDNLIDAKSVHKYLTSHDVNTTTFWDLDHAEFALRPSVQDSIAAIVNQTSQHGDLIWARRYRKLLPETKPLKDGLAANALAVDAAAAVAPTLSKKKSFDARWRRRKIRK
ncbi:uncharacterized protein BJ171DRAFT_608846 [Polychytrium aggregatum]|uniref:uncharacterized protein n=1 Tax=Polychytrium aggregatum TaxID=110093 RepID=UPI0022FE859C|nr:uncharacterized protein BJ171DRAFT_608846 [Polychytrium aggregatum]KAI9209627.1 hypothetical protein BJ171DRAFT_608846 [Polychytrium aggregatum]